MRNSSLQTPGRVISILVLLALLLSMIPPAAVAAPPKDGTITYTVQFGDTLFSLARRFGTSVEAIMAANGLVTDFIFVGQRLVIPVGAPPAPPIGGFGCKYVVQPRDTLFAIAYRYQTSVDSLMRINFLFSPFIYIGQVLSVPCISPTPPAFATYTVQPGDNLFRIGLRFGTTAYAIALANGIPNPGIVYVGQVLVIPYPSTYPNVPVPLATPAAPIPTETPGPTPTATSGAAGSVCTVNCVVIIPPQSNRFEPQTLTIGQNVSVTWINIDSMTHTVTSGVGAPNNIFRSPPMPSNSVYSFTFTTPGTYPYFDEIQGAAMNGVIIVQ